MKYITVKNLEKYQHYRNRRPPWIKIYQDMLEDVAFTCLQDASRSHLVCIWLLASRYENRIPYDAKWIEKAIIASGPVDIDVLVSAGFLTVCEDASNALAKPSEIARPEKREERAEKESSSPPAPPPAPTIREFNPVSALLTGLPESVRPAWEAELAVAKEGMHGPPLSDEDINRACRDFIGNGGLQSERPSLKHFRGYLRNTEERPASPRGASHSRSSMSSTIDDEAAWHDAMRIVGLLSRGLMDSAAYLTESAALRAGFSAVGGWTTVRDARATDLPFRKREFLAAYRAASHSTTTTGAAA